MPPVARFQRQKPPKSRLGRYNGTRRPALTQRSGTIPSGMSVNSIQIQSNISNPWDAAFQVARRMKGERPGPVITPFDVCETELIGLRAFHGPDAFAQDISPIIVVGDTAEDFALYYLLSRLSTVSFWYPRMASTDLLQLYSEVEIGLGGIESRYARPIVTSCSRESSMSLMVAQSIRQKLQPLFDFDNQPFLSQKPLWLQPEQTLRAGRLRRMCTQHSLTTHVGPYIGGVGSTSVSLPVPRCLLHLPATEAAWVVDYSTLGHVVTPRHSLRHLLSGSKFSLATPVPLESIRASREGESRLIPSGPMRWNRPVINELDSLQLVRGTDEQILGLMAEDAGFSLHQSDKGSYASGFIALIGDLDRACNFSAEPLTKRVLWAFFIPRKENAPGLWVGADGRRTLTARDIATYARGVYGKTEKAYSASRSLLDRAVDWGLFETGHMLRCPSCLQMAWYSVENLGFNFRCRLCSSSIRPGRNHARLRNSVGEAVVSYRLAEIAAQFWSNNGAVPLRTLAAIRRAFRRRHVSFLYTTESIFRNKSKNRDVEIDVFASIEGRLVIGECKSDRGGGGKKLTLAAVKRMRTVALQMQADIVLFASDAREWTPGDRGIIDRVFEEFPGVTVLWTIDDLESRCPRLAGFAR